MGNGSNMCTVLSVYVTFSVNLPTVNPYTQTVVDNRLHSMTETESCRELFIWSIAVTG